MTWTGLLTILSLLVSLFPQVVGQPVPTASAHNLQTKMVYMFFDPNTQTMLDTRIAGPSWTPPTPLLQVDDELGIIIKVVPTDGTTTGVGGHVDFYVPNGVTVVDAAYLLPGDANPGRRHQRLRQGADEGPVADRHRRRPHRRQEPPPSSSAWARWARTSSASPPIRS